MNAQDKQSILLAARIANYCRSNALSLGGLVDRIAEDYRLTQANADAVIEYCQDHCLTLNGLLSEIAIYANELNELASVANEIKGVAAEYIDERYDELTEVEKACLVEITTSVSISNSRIIELFKASGLTY
jgi:hypothetical protein